MRWQTTRSFNFLILITLILFLAPSTYAEAPNKKWQFDVDSYIRVAFGSGTRDRLLKLASNDRIPFEISCSIPSENICKTMKEKFFRIVLGNINFRLKLDLDPILRVEFFDKVNSEAIKRVMSEEFVGDPADISDLECELFYRLDGSTITSAKILVSADQSERKIEACMAFQIAQAIGLGAVDGAGFATNWTRNPGGMKYLDEAGIRFLSKSIGFYEYMQMCSELRAGMTPTEVRHLLELPNSCMSKIGGIQ
jgi:hypothetical protein